MPWEPPRLSSLDQVESRTPVLTGGIINKSDVIKALANEGVDNAEGTFNKVLEVFVLGLACGEDIVIRNFGKFEPRTRSAVTRKNPRTGIEVAVPEKQSVGFVPAPALKARLNRP